MSGVDLTGENALTANEARALGAFADAFMTLAAGNDDLALHAAVPHMRSAASKLRAALTQPSSNEEKLREPAGFRDWLHAEINDLKATAEDDGEQPEERLRADHWWAAYRSIEATIEQNDHAPSEKRLRDALHYIAGEDVAGFEAHMRPQEVARAALREETP